MRTIAFDIGAKRIGVAIGDSSGMIASPLEVYTRGDRPDDDACELAGLARSHGAERIVVGMPLTLKGREELAAEKVHEFVALLREHADCEVVYWDERLTTAIAERAMIAADVSREKRRARIDQVAAALILQSYLDAQRRDTNEDIPH